MTTITTDFHSLIALNSGAYLGRAKQRSAQVIEIYGGRYWTRTSDPCDVNTEAFPQPVEKSRRKRTNVPYSFRIGSPQSWAKHGRRGG